MRFSVEDIDTYVDAVIKGQTTDLKVPPGACLVDGPVEPFTMVIFGASDLQDRSLPRQGDGPECAHHSS